MKQKIKYLAIAVSIVVLAACSSGTESGFELKGKLGNSHGEMIFLERMGPEGLKRIDSVTLDEKGEFVMKPAISEVGFFRLRISPKNFATFIFDANQKVTVGGEAADLGNTYTVEGSEDSKLFWEISKASENNYRHRDSLQKVFQTYVNTVKMDSVRMDSMSNELEKPYTALVNKHNVYLQDFINKHPSSLASLAAIQQLPPEQFMEIYIKLDKELSAKYPKSEYTKAFHDGISIQKKVDVGTTAPEISMNTPDGKPLSLLSLRGKIVLVDFWASWCGPCRAENPNVVSAYNNYKSKGFEIFSVSLDSDLEKWKHAILADNLSWPYHVCDFKKWESPVVRLYNFNSIPSNFLVSKEGVILAKDLRGEDLEKKLEEVFK